MLLTVEDISKMLGIKPSTIRYKVFRNEIPYLKVGKHVRFKPEVIEKWLNKSCQPQKGGIA